MFPPKVPRLFVLASFVLLFLVTYITLHLYHRFPPSYPTANAQVIPIPNAVIKVEQPGTTYTEHVAVAVKAAGDVPFQTPATPTPSPTAQDEEPNARIEETLASPPTQPFVESPVASLFRPPAQSPGFDSGLDDGDRPEQGHEMPLPDPKDCPKDLRFLVRSSIDLELTERVRYVRRYIKPVFSKSVDRDDVANITEPLVKDDVEVDLYDCGDAVIPSSAPIKLHVPMPYSKTTFTHLSFGVATDYGRLKDSVGSFAHWISSTRAKLVAVVMDAKEKPPNEMDQLQQDFEMAGINVTLAKPINDTFTTSQNHFTVLVKMLEHSNPDTQWYGLLDDDTFFPSLKPLSDTLATVDHRVDAYVGALSEDFAAVRSFGFMAFGGAGAFISAPLAQKLGDHALQCIDEATGREGDVIIRDCVYTYSKAKLTILPGLYQQDMRDDVSGFFEAGLKPLNLHHWKSWYKEPVEKMAAAAKFCGHCFLQRWRFGTDTVFSNGFSIAMYRDGLEAVDLGSTEGTWVKADSRDYDFSLGPLREPYPADQKKSYKLREAEFSENGDLKQLYVRAGDSSAGELDEVVELIWEKH